MARPVSDMEDGELFGVIDGSDDRSGKKKGQLPARAPAPAALSSRHVPIVTRSFSSARSF